MKDGDVPGQELCDAVDRVVSDPGQDVSKVVLWVDPVELGCAEQRVDFTSRLTEENPHEYWTKP